MATNKKITELTELVEADLANDDVLAIVDVSAGETFKVRKSTLASAGRCGYPGSNDTSSC